MTHWALDLIGRPWLRGAAGPDAFDCWGLVRHCYATRWGVALPPIEPATYSAHGTTRAVIAEQRAGRFAPAEGAPREGDVVLMSQARRPHHVGLWLEVDGGGVLHSVEGAGVGWQRLPDLKAAGWHRIEFWRRTCCT